MRAENYSVFPRLPNWGGPGASSRLMQALIDRLIGKKIETPLVMSVSDVTFRVIIYRALMRWGLLDGQKINVWPAATSFNSGTNMLNNGDIR